MICVIAGLTATGKSDVAISLAQKWNAEIISADSVAVYKGLDIGSAKASVEDQSKVIHHLIDVYEINQPYNVAVFQREARKKIEEIQNRGKNVIVVGGTGLYIKALLYDYHFEQEDVEVKERTEETVFLYQDLVNKDPQAAEKIDPQNRKRIIRALHSFDYHGKTRSELNQERKDTILYDAKVFFLHTDRDVVYDRINQRVVKMFEMGLEQEVQNLYDQDSNVFEYNSMKSIGYREFEPYFKGIIDKETLISEIQKNTRRFAKRQMTWFKHQQPSVWLDVGKDNVLNEIVKYL